MFKTKRTSKKRLIVVVLVLFSILTSGLYWYYVVREENPKNPSTEEAVKYAPPTKQEIEETERFKQDLGSQDEKSNSTSSNPSNPVSVTISYVAPTSVGIEAGGYISNILENDGTCTLTLTRGSYSVSATSTGIVDVNKTTCPQIRISNDKIPERGEWSAVLGYSSGKNKGFSDSQKVVIP